MLSPLDRLAYLARQGSRVAWYMGHYFASQRYRPANEPKDVRRERPRKPGPGRNRMLADLVSLFERDLRNVEAGHYPMPRDREGSPSRLLARSRAYFADLPEAASRKAEGRGDEVRSPDLRDKFPAYFLQNFHYQTGGYLTEQSAALYDMQVEVLFSGSANAMRRQCLVPVSAFLRGRDQRNMSLLDVACGTGRFLRFAREAFPRLGLAGTDLSESYLAEARRHLANLRPCHFLVANAERLPFADASFDVVTSIYLFHEVPPKVRRIIAGEFARVLRPGGRLVFMDSLQTGDAPAYDGLLEAFPVTFHEPYYLSYLREDLGHLFVGAGLEPVSSEPVFLSKLVVCDRPG
jgi:ubiquinone/menaquinone biosynthesis C-methylase UbiE